MSVSSFQKGTGELLKYLRSRIKGTTVRVQRVCAQLMDVTSMVQITVFICFTNIFFPLVKEPDGSTAEQPKTAMTLPSQARIDVHSINTLKTLNYRYDF